MSRRSLLFIIPIFLTLALIAFLLSQISPKGFERSLVQQLRQDFGLEVSVHGKSTLALLPSPHLKLEDVQITGANGALSIREATLKGEIGILGLLRGQADLTDIAIHQAKTVLDLRQNNEEFLAALLAKIYLRGSDAIQELTISEGALSILREEQSDISIGAINVVMAWTKSSGPLSASGAVEWRGETITISKASLSPSLLLNGKKSPFALELSALESELIVSGNIQADRFWNVMVDGTSLIRSHSLDDLTRWSDLPIPLASSIKAFSLEGGFFTRQKTISWPSVTLKLGTNKLEGSLAIRMDRDEPSFSGTLATERLDLSDYIVPFLPNRQDLSHSFESQTDLASLDLRLSATAAKVANLDVSDLALGLILKPGKLEVSLGRAAFERGTFKGKVQITHSSSLRDIKLQGSIENINLSRLMQSMGRTFFISGLARSQFALEGSGTSYQEIVRNFHGKMTLSAVKGELKGINLSEMLLNIPKADETDIPLPVSPGETSFDLASLGMIIEAGTGIITDGSLQLNGARTSVTGQMSLVDQTLTLQAITKANDKGSEELLLIMNGPWVSPEITARVQTSPIAPQE